MLPVRCEAPMHQDKPVTIETVITTYNRRHIVECAIRSAFEAFPTSRVTVVDDASTDGTTDYLRDHFPAQIARGQLRLIAFARNIGVTGAKNAGYEQSSADWVIFLDSDDAYLPDCGPRVLEDLTRHAKRPIVFFRCIDEQGKFVGSHQGEERLLDLKTYLASTSFGEALTAVNRGLSGNKGPYEPRLRGYEGLGCCRLIRDFGPAVLSAHTVRAYDTSGVDRLSRPKAFIRRMPLLSKGHFQMIAEFGAYMDKKAMLRLAGVAAIYFLLGHAFRAVVER